MEIHPPTTGKEPKLVAKLAEIMKDVSKIPKNGKNTFHNYKYVMESDLVEAIRAKLGEKSIFITSCTKGIEVVELSKPTKGGEVVTQKIGVLRVEYTFHDGETGESLTMESIGEIDQDGGKGLYKALTGAMKYFLMKNFLVATGDDPEQDSAKAAAPSPRAAATVTPKPLPKPTAPKPPPPPKPLFPREDGDVMLSKEQMAEINTLWPELMEHQNAPVEERDALLQKSLMSKYGVKTLSYLRSKQAAHMIEGLNAALKKPELPLPQAA
jgi:hypothetical protein